MKKILGSSHKEVFLKVDRMKAENTSLFLVELRRKRMVVFCEVEIGDKINESQIKLLEKIELSIDHFIKVKLNHSLFKIFFITNHKLNYSTDLVVENHILSYKRLKNPKFKDELVNNT
jgi:hypothetical protein